MSNNNQSDDEKVVELVSDMDDSADDDGVTIEVVEHEEDEGGRKVPRKGIYLLPNLFTTAALFAGFYAVVAAMNAMNGNGSFEYAAVAICIAGVLDGFDGAVARLTNTQSEFGAQYDSMSDLVAFGVAPALVCYAWMLSDLGKVGWMCAFVFAACAALRLARFNVQAGSTDRRFFIGLPSPSAAAVIATMVWVGAENGWSGSAISVMAAIITAVVGFLMISNIRYRSFKEIQIGRVPFAALFGAIIIFAIVFLDPPMVLFAMAITYASSAFFLGGWRKQKTEA